MIPVYKIRDTEQMFSSVSGRRDSASIQGLFATLKKENNKKKLSRVDLRKRTSRIVTGHSSVSYWPLIFQSPQ